MRQRWLAFGGSPRRHGWPQLGKAVRLDPGRGPGTDFEPILNCRCLDPACSVTSRLEVVLGSPPLLLRLPGRLRRSPRAGRRSAAGPHGTSRDSRASSLEPRGSTWLSGVLRPFLHLPGRSSRPRLESPPRKSSLLDGWGLAKGQLRTSSLSVVPLVSTPQRRGVTIGAC